jgi:hypothetical protein
LILESLVACFIETVIKHTLQKRQIQACSNVRERHIGIFAGKAKSGRDSLKPNVTVLKGSKGISAALEERKERLSLNSLDRNAILR